MSTCLAVIVEGVPLVDQRLCVEHRGYLALCYELVLSFVQSFNNESEGIYHVRCFENVSLRILKVSSIVVEEHYRVILFVIYFSALLKRDEREIRCLSRRQRKSGRLEDCSGKYFLIEFLLAGMMG